MGQKNPMIEKGPQRVCQVSKFVKIPHPPGPVQCNGNHWNAFYFDTAEQTREKLEIQEGVVQVERIPRDYQRIHRKGLRLPGPGNKPIQLLLNMDARRSMLDLSNQQQRACNTFSSSHWRFRSPDNFPHLGCEQGGSAQEKINSALL